MVVGRVCLIAPSAPCELQSQFAIRPDALRIRCFFVLTLGCSVSKSYAQTRDSQVLFVCEHGNVKSLMAASYFNQLAQERGLPFRAVSRGTALDSTTVPPAIIQGLRGDGFDVSSFHPLAVKASDVSASQRVITIGATLPSDAQPVAHRKTEQWNDVPPASVDY